MICLICMLIARGCIFPIVIHANLTKVFQLSQPSLFHAVTNHHCGYDPCQHKCNHWIQFISMPERFNYVWLDVVRKIECYSTVQLPLITHSLMQNRRWRNRSLVCIPPAKNIITREVRSNHASYKTVFLKVIPRVHNIYKGESIQLQI